MTLVDCSDDAAWTAYLEGNPAIWGQEHLRPEGEHLLPVFVAPPPGSLKFVLAGPPGSGKTGVLDELRRKRPWLAAGALPKGEWGAGLDVPDLTGEIRLVYRSRTLRHRATGPAIPLLESSPIDTWRFFAPDVIAGTSERWKADMLRATGIGALTDFFSSYAVLVFYLDRPGTGGPAADREWRDFYFPEDGEPRPFQPAALWGDDVVANIEYALFGEGSLPPIERDDSLSE